MRSGALRAAALFVTLIMGTFVALEGENLGKQMGLIEKDPVLVFVVPIPENSRRIRAAVSKERVVWEGEAGFALAGERVITPRLETAGEVIAGAGWLDRPIRIVTLQADPESETESDPGSPVSKEARRKRLLELVHQPTLSRGEQIFILQAMNDGIEI